jgi:hypothetical protein
MATSLASPDQRKGLALCTTRGPASRRLLSAVLLALLANASPPAQATEVADSALAYVQERHLGDSLGWLGYQVASRTPTFGSIVEAVGKTQAQVLMQDELQRLQPQYQAQWDRNLAAAYARYFTADELQALGRGDNQPQLANKLRAGQNDVGTDMKARSADLLKDYVSRALNDALARLP